MNVATRSKRSELWLVLVVGCIWGLTESCGRMALHSVSILNHNGSILAGLSVLFFAAAFAMSARWWTFALLPAVACVFKMYIAGLQHHPILCLGNNALYAYFAEAIVFGGVVYLAKPAHRASWFGGAMLGATSAVIAANAFILVPLVSGQAACVVAGSAFPSSIAGLTYSAPIAALAAPIGFRLGGSVQGFISKAPAERPTRLWPVGTSIATACIVVVTLAYVG